MNGGGHRISIDRNAYGLRPRVTFTPDPLHASTLDQIFWTNNDSDAHWPGLLNANETINTTFFMPSRIGNGETSPSFVPTTPAVFNYVCSIHPDERGVIIVV